MSTNRQGSLEPLGDRPDPLNQPVAHLGHSDRKLLEVLADKHGVPVGLIYDLLAVENDLSGMGRRHGLNDKIGDLLSRYLRPQGE